MERSQNLNVGHVILATLPLSSNFVCLGSFPSNKSAYQIGMSSFSHSRDIEGVPKFKK